MNGPDFQYDGLTAFAPITKEATSSKKGLMSPADKAALDLLASPPRARLTRATNQAAASGGNVAIAFDAATYNTAGATAGTAPWALSDSTRLYVPTGGDGVWAYTAWVTFDTVGAGRKIAFLLYDGATVIAQAESGAQTAVGTSFNTYSLAAEYPVVAGKAVQLVVFQNSGGAVNILANGAVLTGRRVAS